LRQFGGAIKSVDIVVCAFIIDSGRIFYAGKSIFPFNAKIDSLDGKLQHDITEMPVELEEFRQFAGVETLELLRAGDEHFVVLNKKRDKLIGWGFNSHHQLATIDPQRVLSSPDVFYAAEDDETIKLVECGKLSTCVVTGNNNSSSSTSVALYIDPRLSSF